MLRKKPSIREYDFRWHRTSEIDCVLRLLPQCVQCSITVNPWIRVDMLTGNSGKVRELEYWPEKSGESHWIWKLTKKSGKSQEIS